MLRANRTFVLKILLEIPRLGRPQVTTRDAAVEAYLAEDSARQGLRGGLPMKGRRRLFARGGGRLPLPRHQPAQSGTTRGAKITGETGGFWLEVMKGEHSGHRRLRNDNRDDQL